MKKMILILPILLIAGCASLPYPPTTIHADRPLPSHAPRAEAERYAYDYILAMKSTGDNPELSCKLFSNLYNYKKFPLQRVSLLRALEVCAKPSSAWPMLNELESSSFSWEAPLLYKSLSHYAEKLNNHEAQADYLLKMLPFLKTKQSKEEALSKAYALAPQSEKILAQLRKLAPRLIKNISPEDYFNVGKDFSRIRDFAQARKHYQMAINDPTLSAEIKRKSAEELCQTFKLERNKEKHTECLSASRKQSQANGALVELIEIKLSEARALWSNNKTDIAEKLYQELLNEPLSESQKTLVLQTLGRISMEKLEYTSAVNYLNQAELLSKDSKLLVDLLWYKGLSLYFIKEYDQAAIAFTKATTLSQSFYDQHKLLFWTAKSIQKSGNIKQASELFSRLADRDPFHYYGIMAQREINRPFSPLEKDSTLSDQTPWPTLEWLITVGERELVTSFLKETILKSKDLSHEEKFRVLYKANHFDELIQLFNTNPPETRTSLLLNGHAELLFPRPYTESIKEAAKGTELPLLFIYALIRQESAFNLYSRSSADAFGMMQITPEKAKEFGVPFKTNDDLYNLDINLKVGLNELQISAKKYNHDYIAVVSSYNAGDAAYTHWKKTRYREDPVEFIELIAYEETRTYIKTILRNMIIYKRLESTREFYFPQNIFTDIRTITP